VGRSCTEEELCERDTIEVRYNSISLGERGASQPDDGVTIRGWERLIESAGAHNLHHPPESEGLMRMTKCLRNPSRQLNYYLRRIRHDHVSDEDEMAGVFVFFCKHIREVNRASDMFDFYIFLFYFFADCVFPDLYVSESFGGHTF
jgi:hypothetical protein